MTAANKRRFWRCWKAVASIVGVIAADALLYIFTGLTLFDPATMVSRFSVGVVLIIALGMSVCFAGDCCGLFAESSE